MTPRAPRCPGCGAAMTVVVGLLEEAAATFAVRGRPLPTRRRLARFVACDRCEVCLEARKPLTPGRFCP